jgi:anti-anti-sigma factor
VHLVAGAEPLWEGGDVDHADMDPVFSVKTEEDGGRRTVVVSGEVDMATAGAMFDAATAAPGGTPPTALVMNLTRVTFFDSAAIHALVRIAERYGGALRVVPSGQVRRVLEISGLSGQPWLVHP